MHLDRCDRAEREALALRPEHGDLADRLDVRDRARRQLHDQVEGPLALPHLGRHGPAECRLDHRLYVRHRQPDARDGRAVDAYLHLRLAGQALASHVGGAGNGLDHAHHAVGELLEALRILAEDLDPQLALDARHRLVDVVLDHLAEEEPDAGKLAHRALHGVDEPDAIRRGLPFLARGEAHQDLGLVESVDVGPVVGPAELRHHVAHLGEGREALADLPHDRAGVRWRDRLGQQDVDPERPLVELGEELGADEPEGDRGHQ